MANKPSERRHGHHILEEHLNIIPVMNLFILLIPFLLLSAVFVQIGIIETSLPRVATSPVAAKELRKKITLTCAINNKGFILRGINPTKALTEGEANSKYLSAKGALITKKEDGSYNFGKLNFALKGVKKSFPDEDTIFILPESYVLYDDIIKTMDTSRERHEKAATEEAKIIKTLFPNAVIAGNID